MDSITPQSKMIKRPTEDSNGERSRKMARIFVKKEDDGWSTERVFGFRVLLPNGTSLDLKIHRNGGEMLLEEFVDRVKQQYLSVERLTEVSNRKRQINWTNQDLHFVDANENKIRKTLNFKNFMPNTCHILRLQDGSGESGTYENMWDLTPDADLLKELPEEYTFETALADLIDNSLQAVWSNARNLRKLISVEIAQDKIEIFDTGPGMDGSHENSIVKWGKMGASLHRLAREQGIGGKPPYLTPFFGMFGYGGPFATMHLGRHALVSSKTKQSKKVYKLYLEREALLSSNSEQTWRTNGGLRDPEKGELKKAPHGSFTKVEIFEPKLRGVKIRQLRSKLKDIYFPYIQHDEVPRTGKTIMPIEFQVNGTNLAEISSGEVALTNLNSCNGPDFILQLHFVKDVSQTSSSTSPGCRASREANARLKCVYLPITQGEESIKRILDQLVLGQLGTGEDHKTFSHVSVRRLGRLLPDARWALLPFMEPKQRKGGKAEILKRCCYRVKCFIDTDAGFNPTPSKMDLAYQNPFTIALKSFGKKHLEKEKEVHIEIYKDGRELNLSKLEKLYEDWILEMHACYDKEIISGNDEPVIVLDPSNKKGLGISSDVARVHKVFQRKEAFWRCGQKIKILKGAYVGHYRTNTYATLEYIILEGWEGDAGGEARLICRPMDIPEESGCTLVIDNGKASIEMGRSISMPISVIDSGKCVAIDDAVWDSQLQKCSLKVPSSIDILSAKDCHDFGIKGLQALPDDVIDAGYDPPEEIVAVVRPASLNCTTASKIPEEKYIIQDKLEIKIEIKFRAQYIHSKTMNSKTMNIFSGVMTPSLRKGCHGFYVFQLREELPELFQKAGLYTFLFALKGLSNINFEKNVEVRALSEVRSWRLLDAKQNAKFTVRVDSCFPPFSIACFDKYDNRIPFPFDTKVMIKLSSCKGFTARVCNMKVHISADKFSAEIKDVQIESSELDMIRPSYDVILSMFSQDELFSVAIPCQVMPGVPRRVVIHPLEFRQQLLPGKIIKDLFLEVFDAYDNHAQENENIRLQADGFRIQDKLCLAFKVNHDGYIDLSGLLKVGEGYGKSVSFSVMSYDQMICKEEFQIERRELRAAFEVPIVCAAGTQLENLVFEVMDMEGEVDDSIHSGEKNGQSHSLKLVSDSLDIDDSLEYSFNFGRCTIPSIPVPQKEGNFFFEAAHSHHPELHLNIEVHLLQHLNMKHENVQCQRSEDNNFLCQEFSELEALCDDPHQSADRRMLLLADSSAPPDVGNLMKCIRNDHRELEDYGLCIKELESTIETLNLQQLKIEADISNLQACLDLDDIHDLDCTSEKELVMEQIVCKGDSAAAVICRLFQSLTYKDKKNDFADSILGVVAFLGTVRTNDLSRILAQYLGEHQMLAIVCKSYEEAAYLEKYEPDGRVNNAYGLHALAAELGISISKQYLVLCLENIRPYTGDFCTNPQRNLALPNPTLPNGKPPPGFLGYAVNMIDLDVNLLQWRTASGYGLRETLFYRLFGELQVYENRQYMSMANCCIKDTAVSLDGGIFKGDGVISLGYWEAEIQFPVVPLQSQHWSPRTVEIAKEIEAKKQELGETSDQLKREQTTHSKVMKKFRKKKDRYERLLDKMG